MVLWIVHCQSHWVNKHLCFTVSQPWICQLHVCRLPRPTSNLPGTNENRIFILKNKTDFLECATCKEKALASLAAFFSQLSSFDCLNVWWTWPLNPSGNDLKRDDEGRWMPASPSFPVRLPAEMPGSQTNHNGSGLGRQKWTCLSLSAHLQSAQHVAAYRENVRDSMGFTVKASRTTPMFRCNRRHHAMSDKKKWRCLICSQEASLAAVISSGRVSTRSMSSWCTGALVPRVVSKSVASPQRPWRFQWLDRPDSISQLAGWLKMNRNGHMHNSIFILHHWSVSIVHSLFHFMKPFHSLWKVKCHLVPMGHVGRCHKGDTLSCKKHNQNTGACPGQETQRNLDMWLWPLRYAQSGVQLSLQFQWLPVLMSNCANYIWCTHMRVLCVYDIYMYV